MIKPFFVKEVTMQRQIFSNFRYPFSFGGASLSGEGGGYGFGDISEDAAISLVRAAYDRGVEVFDTAPVYGFGLSEERIGKAVKHFREKCFIVSKCGVSWHDNMRINMTNDPVTTQKMLEQSLRDLESDYIDLYMIHWPDKKIDIRRPMEILEKAKREGKIKHIGLCNTNISDLKKAKEIAPIESVQSEFNFFETDLEQELFPYLKKNSIDFMSWGTLDKGVLSYRVDEKRSYDRSDCRSWAPWWKKVDRTDRYAAMEKLKPLLENEEITGLQFAIGHNLSFSEVSSILIGPKSIEQLDTIMESLVNFPDKEVIIKARELIFGK